MNLSQQLVFIAVFVASAVATASAAGNNYLRHHPVMTESAIATSDGDADADAGDEDEDVADRMAALIIFNGVELKCRPTNALCSSSSQCCTGCCMPGKKKCGAPFDKNSEMCIRG